MRERFMREIHEIHERERERDLRERYTRESEKERFMRERKIHERERERERDS